MTSSMFHMRRVLPSCGRVVSRRAMSTGGKVGFIGLGNMGNHMVRNLLQKGNACVVFDLSESAMRAAESNGATIATSPAEVASQASTIITMLPSSPHVTDVYTNPASGVFSRIQEGSVLIDSSTIDPGTSQHLTNEAMARGAQMVDAPVSGGVGGAEAGTLTFMVGGTDRAFDDARGTLMHMGKNIVHCGGAGMGQTAKITNNLVLGVCMVAVAEGMNFGAKAGMDPAVLAGIINTSTGRCWSSDTYNPYPGVMAGVPSSRDFQGGFGVDLMKKDLGLAVNAGAQTNATLPLTALVHQLYAAHSAGGSGKKDFSSIIQWIAGYANDIKPANSK